MLYWLLKDEPPTSASLTRTSSSSTTSGSDARSGTAPQTPRCATSTGSPLTRDVNEAFAVHRDECDKRWARINDPSVTLATLSYRKLWADWDTRVAPEWLGRHLAKLRERYEVVIG
jgi:hypothetical protein